MEKIILGFFQNLNINYTPKLTINETAIDFQNTRLKMIESRKRDVIKSDTFIQKFQGFSDNLIIDDIEREFQNGNDVNPHLSRQAIKPDYDDMLLNDWGIHHMHISNTRKNPNQYFYDRSDQLLFIKVLEENIYFVEIRSHNENLVFCRNELIEIINKNWPKLINTYQLNCVSLEKDFTEEERSIFRKAGVTIPTEINDKFYFSPGGGYATSGKNIPCVDAADSLVKNLRDIESNIKAKEKNFMILISGKVQKTIKDLSIELVFNDPNYLVIEKNTGIRLFEIG
ncbi:MAG: hypothetical protein EHM58_18875 [Ignavibacteriae bacterium]|nr:MAG: hypothetical protein EHM58_18875 [Ignavibacteriota bacterium]